VAPQLVARLLFDCHGEPRRLEVTLPEGGIPEAVQRYLRPFGAPLWVATGGLAIVDRPGYFRLTMVPGRLQAILRKQAPLAVVAELVAQLEAALSGRPLRESDCAAGALRYAEGTLTIDGGRCTACLDCVRPGVRAEHLPPFQLAADEAQPGPPRKPEGS
jgi:hypothetical protein